MSHAATDWAMKQRLTETPTQKLVLIVLADAHNGLTGKCFPTHERIAEQSSVSVAQTKRVLKQLESLGLITKHASRGRGRASEYVLHVGKGVVDEPFIEKEKGAEKECIDAPLSKKGVICDIKRGHTGQEKGAPMTPLSGSNLEYNREVREPFSHSKFCPPDFEPNSDLLRTARYDRDIDIGAELWKFKNHEFTHGKSDWDRAFLKWLASARPEKRNDDGDKLSRRTDELLS